MHNNFFHVDQNAMRQGAKGVPIVGFLSAQIMVLHAISVEILLRQLDGLSKHMKEVQKRRKKKGLPDFTFSPRPQLHFQKPLLVPKNAHSFGLYGMRGWFDQQSKTSGSVTLQCVICDVQLLQL